MISHTSNEYEEELAHIRDQVIGMGALVEELYESATRALLRNDPALAKDADIGEEVCVVIGLPA